MNLKKLWPLALVVAILVVGALLPDLGTDGSADDIASVDPSAEAVETDDAAPASQFSDLPTISVAALPDEALDTLALIESGGPFPFDRDDLVFQNRERLLPDHPRGHYREYTVITPGENDRGARRVVAGADGERYYTADHYSSFSEIAVKPSLE